MTEHRPFDFTNPTAYIYPKAAWDKLRMAGKDRQNVYLYGATGYGKTELLRRLFRRRKSFWFSAQELTAAQLQNLPVPGPEGELNVVIDDLALARADDVQQEILRLLDAPGVWLVMAGRCPLPTWLTRPYVRGRLRVIPEEDLWLSGAEIKQLYLGWGVQLPHRLMEERVVPLVEGNPFAARLLAMEMSRGQSYTDALMDELTRKFYEYLNHAIYDNWPEEIRAVLMQLSVLQHFTLAQAEALTGRKDVNQVLSRAAETGNLFSMREGVYTLRPGVIHSMQLRIEKTYDRTQQADLCRRAGRISEDEGDFPRALALYQKGRCPERLRALLIENARRCPGGGYYYELAPAYLALPEDEVKESPDLIGALSMLHSLALNATESERWYGVLRQYRETHTDPEEQRRAESWQIYLDISLPHRGTADLLDVLADAEEKIARDQLELPAFSVTSGQPSLINGSKDFCDWTREDTAVAARLEEHAGAVLGPYAKGLVTLGLAESRLEKGDDDYQVLELINRGMMENLDGGKFELQYVGAALLARYYLLTGHLADCRKTLQEIEEKARQRGARRIVQNIHALQCRVLLWAGRVEDATLWMKREPPEEVRFNVLERYRYNTRIRVYVAQQRYDRAAQLLARLHSYANMENRPWLQMESNVFGAIVRRRIGDEAWRAQLTDALRRAQEYQFVRLFSREGAALLPLLKELGRPEGVSKEFWTRVVQKTTKMARLYPEYLAVHDPLPPSAVELTDKSLSVLRLQSKGLTRGEIAQKLGLSERSVKYQSEQAYRKLGVNNKTEAIEAARKLNLL